MKKLERIISWGSTLIMLCTWIVSIMWFGKVLNEIRANQEDMKTFMTVQAKFNGRTEMYIELDSEWKGYLAIFYLSCFSAFLVL